MFYFSKSKYTTFLQCPKMLWLKTYHPELAVEDEGAKERMKTGNEVGDLAMGLFGEFEEMTAVDKNGKLNISQMIKNTTDAIARGVENISEASFSPDGLYCAVDILHKENGGYALYEVKSSTTVKPAYIVDIAYQKYVLEKYGINVTGTYVVTMDNQYEFDGKLDIQKLFKIHDVSAQVAKETSKRSIPDVLADAQRTLASKNEPAMDLCAGCHSPYPCVFWNYCARHLPTPSVFDIYDMWFNKKLELYHQGIIELKDVKEKAKLNDIQKRQIDFVLEDLPEHVEKDGLRAFLNGLSYPLHFLDFETMQIVIPEFPNAKPYQQIPFQYSLHYIESEGGELMHREFLAESGEDPRRAIAERLVADIPQNACVLSFSRSFEQAALKNLANLFPDLAEGLMAICNNMQDLLAPFQKGLYYNKAIGNSFSIKSILPAMFPNNPELDYHNLDGIHNGGESMTIFPAIKNLPPEEQQIARKNLLLYCKLDTYAMVKIWQKLKELCQ